VYFTYARSLGGLVFIGGGLLPLMWFIISRGNKLRRKEEDIEEGEWTVYERDWSEQNDRALGG
jgi:hypothetical protein